MSGRGLSPARLMSFKRKVQQTHDVNVLAQKIDELQQKVSKIDQTLSSLTKNDQTLSSMTTPTSKTHYIVYLKHGANSHTFAVPRRYLLHGDCLTDGSIRRQELGHGSYGVVYLVKDTEATHPSLQYVAMKFVPHDKSFEKPHDTRRIINEVTIMCRLAHPNLMPILQVNAPLPHANGKWSDVVYTMPLYKSNLRAFLDDPLNNISWAECKWYILHLLYALRYLHSCNVIHRDVKPENIMVDPEHWRIVLGDFGLGCNIHTNRVGATTINNGGGGDDIKSRAKTTYITTRWYRAPEVILSPNREQYNESIDIWAVGCTLAEFLRVASLRESKKTSNDYRKVVFCGDTNTDQMKRIARKLGTPSSEYLDRYCTDATMRLTIASWSRYTKVRWDDWAPGLSENACNLLDRMLEMDPSKRITADEAVRHPYFRDYFDSHSKEMTTPPQPLLLDDGGDCQDAMWKILVTLSPDHQANYEQWKNRSVLPPSPNLLPPPIIYPLPFTPRPVYKYGH